MSCKARTRKSYLSKAKARVMISMLFNSQLVRAFETGVPKRALLSVWVGQCVTQLLTCLLTNSPPSVLPSYLVLKLLPYGKSPTGCFLVFFPTPIPLCFRAPLSLASSLHGRLTGLSHVVYLTRTSLVVHWLRLCTSNAGGMGMIPCHGTKIPHSI